MRIGAIGIVAALTMLTGRLAAEDPPGAAAALAPADHADSPGEPKVLETLPIDAGYVIFDGKFIARPYILCQKGDEITLNNRPLPLENMEGLWSSRGWRSYQDYDPRSWRSPPDGADPPGSQPRRGTSDPPRQADVRDNPTPGWPSTPPQSHDSPAPRSDWGAMGSQPYNPRRNLLARIERHLRNGAMLLSFRDGPIGLVTSGRELIVLEALLDKGSRQERVRRLTEADVSWMSSAQWGELVDSFVPDPQLERLFASLRDRAPTRVELPESQFANSHSVAYATTVCALVLVVFGMGTLMNHLPKRGVAWRSVDVAGEDVSMLTRNVGLLVVLGTFDLVCTLLTRKASGFWELNPFGNQILDNAMALVGFKFASLLLGATILLLLRRYRGAQTASWWLCLLCTIVALRWATYNSMFRT